MTSNFYLLMDSDNSKNLIYYPDNKPWNFKVLFDNPLNLSGKWNVALTDVFIRDGSKTLYVNNLYVYCNVAGESIVNGEHRQSLLRMLHYVKKGNWTHKYAIPYYMNVNRSQIVEIEIHIKDRHANDASFLKQPVSLTLHFRQYPFFM